MPAARAFDLLAAWRAVAARRAASTDPREWRVNQPAELRFVSVSDPPLLSPVQARGDYAVVEALGIDGFGEAAVLDAFLEIEAAFKAVPGARPHTAKVWGLVRDSRTGAARPFDAAAFRGLLPAANKRAFDRERAALDPNGLFLAGAAAQFLQD